MSLDFSSIQNDLRDLERQVRAVCDRVDGTEAEKQPLSCIALSIRAFAEMLPVYGSFVSLLENAYPADLTSDSI